MDFRLTACFIGTGPLVINCIIKCKDLVSQVKKRTIVNREWVVSFIHLHSNALNCTFSSLDC